VEIEKELANAEDRIRACGYKLPLAWGLGFFLDYEKLLIRLFTEDDKTDLATQVKSLAHEIRTGEIR
jgi:hypothetical protein